MSFLRQVGTVAAGVAGGQLILLAATPLLARTFTPAAFGDYAVFLALYFVTLVVACLRLEFAIPIAPDEMVPALAQAALLSSIAVGALAGLLALSGVVSRLNPQAGAALGWLAVCAPFVGLVQTAIFAAIRAGRFRSNAAIRMLQPACFVAIALFAPSLGLVRSHVLAAGVAAAFAAVTLAPLLKPVRLGAMREALARFKSHPLLSLPSTLLDTLSLACPIFVISSAYGTEVLGNYSQLQRLLAAPLFLLVIGVSEVFFKHASDRARAGGELRPLVLQTFWKLAALATVLFVAAGAVGADIARLLLGPQWRTDTAFILLVISPALVRMSVSPVSNVFIAVGRVHVATAWQVAYFAATYALLPALAARLPIERFLLGYLALEAVMYGAYLTLALRVAPRPREAA